MTAPKIKTTITLIFGLIVILLGATLLFSLYTINTVKSNVEIQVQSRTVYLTLKDNLTLLVDAETAERGFIITSDTNYLEPYNTTLKNITANTGQLRTILKDNIIQQTNLGRLLKLIDLKLAYIKKLISLKNRGDETEIAKVMVSNEGKYIMDDIRKVNQQMQSEALSLYEDRRANTEQSIKLARSVFIAEGVFALLITLFLAFIIIREFDRRSRIEKELAASSDRFFKIFTENPVAMTLSEVGTNKIVFVNNLFYKLFGYSREEIIGHTSEELQLISQEELARVYPILLAYLNETRSVAELQALPAEESGKLLVKLKEAMGSLGLEVLYTKKNGDTFDAILFYDMIEIDNKKYTITSYQDISDQKKAEHKILAYTKELERKNKEIEQFAYVSSHDLQEPLRSITNFSTLLADKLTTHPDKSVHEYMGFISGGVKRMSRLIFDLLEYSRIGNDLTTSKIDCNALVNETLTAMSASIKESGAEIHVSKLPVVDGYFYLGALFQNLLSNAIKFRRSDRHPIIHIGATTHGQEHLFSINDNGIGMEKEYHERIFIIFQRLHSRKEFPGTGIGLSQCRKIIELHGGKIWVESEPGKGSTFYFTIPKS